MDEDRWEHVYASSAHEDVPPSAELLRSYAHLLSGGTALDIAMGVGQNAVFLASLGYTVTGVDTSAAAVHRAQQHARESNVRLCGVIGDIRAFTIPEYSYNVIVNFYFLERAVFQKIHRGLKKNGLLFFETYTIDQKRFGRPHNPDFLLQPNELLTAFNDLFVLYYHERIEQTRAVASLIARKL